MEKHKIVFPYYYKIDQNAQMKEVGIVYVSNVLVDDMPICGECKDQGKAYIICSLCNEKKSSNKVKESIGDPPEFLCADCYETKSAKIWEEKCDELYEEHRYDHE